MCVFLRKLFDRRSLQKGGLAQARTRYENGTACPAARSYKNSSCWALIGEEVIDTEHPTEEYDAIYAELIERGFKPDEIDEMRTFAWRTLGWMNYEKMLWDWVDLDEHDIVKALDWQLEEKQINSEKRDQELLFMKGYLKRDPVLQSLAEE